MKTHSTGNIDFKPWWSGLHLSCPDCGSIYELEEDDGNCSEWHIRLEFSCNRCGHILYADRSLIRALRMGLDRNRLDYSVGIENLPFKESEYIEKYLNPTGFKDFNRNSYSLYNRDKLGSGSY